MSNISGLVILVDCNHPETSQLPCCCLQESLGTIQATVGAALAAEVPPGCSRVVYLCDDGKDPEKRKYIEGLGDAAV